MLSSTQGINFRSLTLAAMLASPLPASAISPTPLPQPNTPTPCSTPLPNPHTPSPNPTPNPTPIATEIPSHETPVPVKWNELSVIYLRNGRERVNPSEIERPYGIEITAGGSRDRLTIKSLGATNSTLSLLRTNANLELISCDVPIERIVANYIGNARLSNNTYGAQTQPTDIELTGSNPNPKRKSTIRASGIKLGNVDAKSTAFRLIESSSRVKNSHGNKEFQEGGIQGNEIYPGSVEVVRTRGAGITGKTMYGIIEKIDARGQVAIGNLRAADITLRDLISDATNFSLNVVGGDINSDVSGYGSMRMNTRLMNFGGVHYGGNVGKLHDSSTSPSVFTAETGSVYSRANRNDGLFDSYGTLTLDSPKPGKSSNGRDSGNYGAGWATKFNPGRDKHCEEQKRFEYLGQRPKSLNLPRANIGTRGR